MLVEKILSFIYTNPGITVVGTLTLIQIAPIKIDPWTFIAKWIRKMLIGDIDKKLDQISKKVDDLELQAKEDKAIGARNRILRFADELYNGIHHSREYFDEMLADTDRYEKYCSDHPNFANSKTVMSTQLIKETYKRLNESHGFD